MKELLLDKKQIQKLLTLISYFKVSKTKSNMSTFPQQQIRQLLHQLHVHHTLKAAEMYKLNLSITHLYIFKLTINNF